MKKIQLRTHAGVTTILTNSGVCELSEKLSNAVEKLQFVNGDTRGYGLAVTCSCITFKDVLSLCFSRANSDTVLYDACLKILAAEGLTVSTEVIEGKSIGKENSGTAIREKMSGEKLKAIFNTKI